jgi:hypothetical protein
VLHRNSTAISLKYGKIRPQTPQTKTLQLEKRNTGRDSSMAAGITRIKRRRRRMHYVFPPSLHKSSAHFSFILLFSARINFIRRKRGKLDNFGLHKTTHHHHRHLCWPGTSFYDNCPPPAQLLLCDTQRPTSPFRRFTTQ